MDGSDTLINNKYLLFLIPYLALIKKIQIFILNLKN